LLIKQPLTVADPRLLIPAFPGSIPGAPAKIGEKGPARKAGPFSISEEVRDGDGGIHRLTLYLLWYINKNMNGKQVIKILEANGWVLNRIKGSHHIMAKDGKAVPVPVHGTKDLMLGLISGLEKQTGVRLR
jgi:predicted RNA binding protein YcfA (HicA-like mRNA interferase family)